VLLFLALFIKTTEEYVSIMRTRVQHPDVVSVMGNRMSRGCWSGRPSVRAAGRHTRGFYHHCLRRQRKGRIQANFYWAPVGATLTIYFENQGEEEITLYDGPYVCPDRKPGMRRRRKW
jgi:hypothetical protein